MSEALKADEYRCGMCQGVFSKGWSEEEARAEAEANFGSNYKPAEEDLVCDDCYKKVMGDETFCERCFDATVVAEDNPLATTQVDGEWLCEECAEREAQGTAEREADEKNAQEDA